MGTAELKLTRAGKERRRELQKEEQLFNEAVGVLQLYPAFYTSLPVLLMLPFEVFAWNLTGYNGDNVHIIRLNQL